MLRSIANLLRTLADRLDPPEPEPEVMSYADFCEKLRLERDAEIERELARPPLRRVK